MYAEVIVDITHEQLDRGFEYHVPDGLLDKVEIGSVVAVPFGKADRIIRGYVINLNEECSYDASKVKDIAGLPEKDNSVEERSVRLATWIKSNYGGTLVQALKCVLPAKQKVSKLKKKTIVRIATREETISLLGEAERKHQNAKVRLLKELVDREAVPGDFLTKKYGISMATIASLEKAGIIKCEEESMYRNPVNVINQNTDKHILSEEQKLIIDSFVEDYDKEDKKPYLIHGITGSGKTEVYMNMIEYAISRGQQAIFLIPEIALTYQTLMRFYDRFQSRVSVINSMLSPGERFDQCERAKKGEIDVIIGPRSALFVPFLNLGVIIMDEEHEASYKSENTPKYHAREVAFKLAQMTGASFVMGSATPSVDSFYRAKNGEIRLFSLTKRLTGGQLPGVYTIDMREELRNGNTSVFSRKLTAMLEERLSRHEQSMVFINRRGYAGFVSCRNCGNVIKCPHCDVSLTEHYGRKMICHYCGYTTEKPVLCPKCGSKYIGGFKAGTEQIEEKLKAMFPQAKTLRMDADTTEKKDSYEKILSAFSSGEADILIGTQMIVKGHDFPNVTLVGVIAADLSLGISDYRSAEKTFELLTQAVGRAGRGDKPGEAVIQTYQPEHYAIVTAANQDYDAFYEEESFYRDTMQYPPTAHMLSVLISSKDEKLCESFSEKLVLTVKKEYTQFSGHFIIGPTAARVSKINDIYRYTFYVKLTCYSDLVMIKDFLESKVKEQNNYRINVTFDFDPMNSV